METNWTWGLSLITLTIAVHATALAFMALVLRRIWVRAESPGHQGFLTMITLIAVVGVLLALLHGIEAGLWAAAYWWLGALGSASDALLFSDRLDAHARRFGADAGTPLAYDGCVGSNGRKGFGISTAFIFAVKQGHWQLMTQHLRR